MAADLKRLTFSIMPSLEVELRLAKKEWYCRDTQSDMIRDLIVRGLASLESETEEAVHSPEQAS